VGVWSARDHFIPLTCERSIFESSATNSFSPGSRDFLRVKDLGYQHPEFYP